jgi:uncharacterized phiE125 gp8 family phage protein
MGMVYAEPPALPVSLVELKSFLRISADGEDALLAGLVRSAAGMCEAFTGRALLVREVEETLCWPVAWSRLAVAPVAAIEGVATLGVDGAATALAAAGYAIDIDAAGEGWVRVLQTGSGRIRATYRAGLATDPGGLPEALRNGIIRLAAHLYGERHAERAADTSEPPAAVTALWRPWRRLRLA